jgi:hypothetical protein
MVKQFGLLARVRVVSIDDGYINRSETTIRPVSIDCQNGHHYVKRPRNDSGLFHRHGGIGLCDRLDPLTRLG